MSLKKSIAINSVLLVTDIGAGLILYNFGKGGGKKVTFALPPKKEFLKMTGVAVVASLLTGLAITKVEKIIGVEIFDDTDGEFLEPSAWDEVFTSFKGLSRSIGGASLDGEQDSLTRIDTPASIRLFLERNKKQTKQRFAKNYVGDD